MSRENPRPRINYKNTRGLKLMASILLGTKTEAELDEPEQEDLLYGIAYARDLAKWHERGS